jgi:hypothetical protein
MWGLLLTFGLISGIVKFAWGQSEDPTVKRRLRAMRLAALMQKQTLNKAEIEDGLVLARQFKEDGFRRKLERLKKGRK